MSTIIDDWKQYRPWVAAGVLLMFMLGLTVVLFNVYDVVLNEIDRGLVTGNRSHGEMWNYSAEGSEWTFSLTSAGVYYNLTNINNVHMLKGMTHTLETQANGGSYFNITAPGLYAANLLVSAEGILSNNVFSFAIVENFDVNIHRDCYSRRWISAGNPGSMTITCLMTLGVGDTVNIQIENEDGNRDLKIHAVNLNLFWIDTS